MKRSSCCAVTAFVKIFSIGSFLLTLFASEVYGQKIYQESILPDNYFIRDLQFFNFRDSVLITVYGFVPGVGKRDFRTLLAVPEKEQIQEMGFIALKDLSICAAVTIPNQIKRLYYYQEAKGGFLLKALQLDLRNNRTGDYPGELFVAGKLLGIQVQGEQLKIYSYEKKKPVLQETIIKGFDIVRRKEFKLPFELAAYREQEIAFLPDGSYVGSVQACAPVKVMVKDDTISVVWDRPYLVDGVYSKDTKTTLVVVDAKTGETSMQVFKGPPKGDFRSIVFDSLLFRAATQNDFFELHVFHASTAQLLYTKRIERDSTTKKDLVYFREGRANEVSRTETLQRMIKVSGACDPFLVVTVDPAKKNFVVTFGTYYDSNGASAPVGANPVAGMLTMLVGTAIRQMAEGPGVSRYFYLTGTVESGFRTTEEHVTIRSKVDAYEIAQQENRAKFRYKGYFHYDESLISIYQDGRTNKLSLVKFSF